MSTTLIIGLLVVVVVVVAFLVLRGRGGPALPPEQEDKPQQIAPSATPASAEPSAPAQPSAPEADAAAVDVEVEPAAAPAPAAVPAAPSSAPPPAPSKEDIETLKKGLASTRGGFISRLAKLFGGKKAIDPELLEQLEELLITADVGVKTSTKILEKLRERLDRNELADTDRVWQALREEAQAILAASKGGLSLPQTPTVVLVVGVNGVGKTTTIGKLASKLTEEGKKVVLAAGDTFRAAAVLQLEVWGRRVGCDVVKGKDNADPGSVIFDAIEQAKRDGADVVIADTAGRLHTKAPLMEELKKVARTAEKALGRPVDETLLVLDSTNGQNAIQQAQMFKEAMDVSGIVLTKLDGTAKGGVILGIVDEHALPVRFIGIGERVEDLRVFDTPSFVQALFEKPDGETVAA